MRGAPHLALALRWRLLRPAAGTCLLAQPARTLTTAIKPVPALPVPLRASPQRKKKEKKISPLTLKRLHIALDGDLHAFDSLFLRDACGCADCVHPSTQQKMFQTTDIPYDVRPQTFEARRDGSVRIVWRNDIVTPKHPTGEGHESVYDVGFLRRYSTLRNRVRTGFNDQRQILWDRRTMNNDVLLVGYNDYMRSDEALFRAVKQLSMYGLMFINGIPAGMSDAVEGMAGRIGHLKNTLYGKTWDVRNVKDSKNIA